MSDLPDAIKSILDYQSVKSPFPYLERLCFFCIFLLLLLLKRSYHQYSCRSDLKLARRTQPPGYSCFLVRFFRPKSIWNFSWSFSALQDMSSEATTDDPARPRAMAGFLDAVRLNDRIRPPILVGFRQVWNVGFNKWSDDFPVNFAFTHNLVMSSVYPCGVRFGGIVGNGRDVTKR